MSDDFLQLDCPFCHCRFRIKTVYAHMRGRCPECGFRIAPPRPREADPLPISTSDEPLGLLPLDEEEWPEPAWRYQEDGDPGGGAYAFKPDLAAPPSTAKPRVDAALEFAGDLNIGVYALKDEAPALMPAPAPPNDPKPAESAEVFALAPSADLTAPATEPSSTSTVRSSAPPFAARTETPLDDAFAIVPPALEAPATAEATAAPNVIYPIFLDERPAPRPAEPAGPPPTLPSAPTALPPAAADSAPPEGAPDATPAPAKKKKKRKKKSDEKHTITSLNTGMEYTYRLSDAELNPIREAPLPDDIFFTGVWKLPLQPQNLRAWFWIALGAGLLYFQLALILLVYELNPLLGMVVTGLIGMGMLWVTVILGSYAANALFGIVTDTANGNDEVAWPEGGWKEWFGSLLLLVWLEALSCAAALPFFWLTQSVYGAFALVVGEALIFPILMLGSLVNEWTWLPLNASVLRSVGSRFKYFLALWLLVGVATAPLFLFFVGGVLMWLAPFFGAAFGYVWIIRGRLIGRLGRVLIELDEPVKKKRKKKERPGVAMFAGWGGEADPRQDSAVSQKPPVAKIVEDPIPVARPAEPSPK